MTTTQKRYDVSITYGTKYCASFPTEQEALKFLETYKHNEDALEKDFDDLPFGCYSQDLYWFDNLSTIEEVEYEVPQDLDAHASK
jgi:hypothetical protein